MIYSNLLIAITVIVVTHGRVINSRSVPITVDAYGNRMFLIREHRNPMTIYPHRAMMITEVYQPKYRASSRQSTGVFAHGNAVSSDTYLGNNVPKYYHEKPESIDEPEISSAEAEVAPGPYEIPIIDEKQNNPDLENEEENVRDQKNINTQQNEESPQYQTESSVAKEPVVPQKEIEQRPTKTLNRPLNKGKKTKIHVIDNSHDDDDVDNDNDDDDDGEEDGNDNENNSDEDNDRTAIFNPIRGNRRGAIPAHNNFFPMIFSFPKSLGRRSASGSSAPGMITAIANSYSTGRGGVANSVATAYGGPSNSKKKL